MANESTFCFRMNATERAQLEAIAYAQGRTSSAIAREVLSRFLDGFFSGPQGKTVLAEFRASGGRTYDGIGVANSGWMSTSEQFSFFKLAGTGLPVALTRYKLKFTRVGDFPFICAIHDPAGMVGIVHVVP